MKLQKSVKGFIVQIHAQLGEIAAKAETDKSSDSSSNASNGTVRIPSVLELENIVLHKLQRQLRARLLELMKKECKVRL